MDLKLACFYFTVSAAFLFLPVFGSLAAMSIDLGSQFIKIGLVKPGVPMEIVLNRESMRKTSTVVSIRGKERTFGAPGAHNAIKYPPTGYIYFPGLVGKKADGALVSRYRTQFPYFDIRPHAERGTVVFHENDDVKYSVEELLAMLLSECRQLAEKFADQTVKDVVVTVPPYFNQAERRAVATATHIAGLNLLQLMNDNTAAGLNYGMFRRKEFNDTPSYLLIYDMGASKTTATVLEYKLVKDKVTRDKDPEMTVLGVGYDRTLGGLELTMRLQNHLADQFMKQGKSKGNIKENARAMAKLLKEAERVKQVLSANADHFAQVEGLFEDIDFRHKVTREELTALGTDLFDRVSKPITDSLKMAELSLDLVDYVILMGGGTRSPQVQEKLQGVLGGKPLGKYLNQDEAIALGAVYQAAHLSKGFKVKTFHIKEANLLPIRVDFTKENSSSEDSPEGRRIQRTLFGLKNPFPQKKVMTFSKHRQDFDCAVNYGDNEYMTEEQWGHIGALNLSNIDVAGVGNAVHSKESPEVEYKGVKVHFRLDESGILSLDGAEALFDKSPAAVAAEEESTLSKIGNKISSFFSSSKKVGGDSDDSPAGGEEGPESNGGDGEAKDPLEKDSSGNGEQEKKSEDSTAKETPETGEEKKPGDSKESSSKDDKSKSKSSSKDKKENGKPAGNDSLKNESSSKQEVKKEVKPVTTKEPLGLKIQIKDMPNVTSEELKTSRKMLTDFDKQEKEKAEREEAQNSLEAYLFDMANKLEEEDYKVYATDEEREKILAKIKETSEWFEEAGFDTATKEFKDRLTAIKDLAKDLYYRLEEARERPKLVDAVKGMLNYSSTFLGQMKNLTEDTQIFTDSEIASLEKMINATREWWISKQADQAKLSLNDMPAITLAGVAEKVNNLDREVKYLLNKAKFAKPLKQKEAEKAAKTAAKANATKTAEANKTTDKTSAEAGEKTETAEEPEKVIPGDDKAAEEGETITEETGEEATTVAPPVATPEGGDTKQETGEPRPPSVTPPPDWKPPGHEEEEEEPIDEDQKPDKQHGGEL